MTKDNRVCKVETKATGSVWWSNRYALCLTYSIYTARDFGQQYLVCSTWTRTILLLTADRTENTQQYRGIHCPGTILHSGRSWLKAIKAEFRYEFFIRCILREFVKLPKPVNRTAFGLKIGQDQRPLYTKTYARSRTTTALLRKCQYFADKIRTYLISSQQHVIYETVTRNMTKREAKDINYIQA